MTIKTTITALALAGLTMGGTAMAQNTNANIGGGQGLVVVEITAQEVAENIANDLDLDVIAQDVLDIGSVQVPVGIAANVCDVDANVLAEQKQDEGGATCEAKNTSTAFTKAVQDSINDSAS